VFRFRTDRCNSPLTKQHRLRSITASSSVSPCPTSVDLPCTFIYLPSRGQSLVTY